MKQSKRFPMKSFVFSALLIALLLLPTLAYAANAPFITTINPHSGPRGGGTLIQINGNGFQTGAKVVIGGNQATVQFITPTQIYAIAPASAITGAVTVRVRNPDGQVAIYLSGFIYY